MRKINLLFLMLLLPVCLFSQYVIDPDWFISSKITSETLGIQDLLGVWKARGGYDINKNGKKEIILQVDPWTSSGRSDNMNQRVFWLEEDGSGGYTLLWSHTFAFGSNYSYGDIQVGDVDGDGFEEIWVTMPIDANAADPNPPRLFCFEYDGTKMPDEPTLTWNLNVRDNFQIRPIRLHVDDLDGDGIQEIIVLSRYDDYRAHAGTGRGRTLIIAKYLGYIEPGASDLFFYVDLLDTNDYLTGGGTYDMEIVDFDGNGKKELWVFTWDMLTVNIYECDANAEKVYNHVLEIRQAAEDRADIASFDGVHFIDLDGDGKLEGLWSGATGDDDGDGLYQGKIYLIENVSDVKQLTKNNFKVIGYNIGGDPRGSVVGDFNNNGLPELVFVDRLNKKMISMEYKGTGSLADSTSYIWTEIFADIIPPRVGDVGPRPGDYWFVNAGAKDARGYTELLLPNQNLGEITTASVFIIKSQKSISVEKKAELPEAYKLSQNYPNPFNPSTNIEFSIPKAAHVSLKIHNVLGQEMSTLVNETKEAGSYIATFNAKDLPSGIYYYTIKSGNYIESKKMMLVK
jgi:hypothetical protein